VEGSQNSDMNHRHALERTMLLRYMSGTAMSGFNGVMSGIHEWEGHSYNHHGWGLNGPGSLGFHFFHNRHTPYWELQHFRASDEYDRSSHENLNPFDLFGSAAQPPLFALLVYLDSTRFHVSWRQYFE
jgi:hypothetical protein